MATKEIEITLQGVSPLLMHRFPLEPIEAIEKKTPKEQAEIAAHRDPDTDELFIPGVAVSRALINGAVYSKGKGRASLQKVAAACFVVTPMRLTLGTKEYVVDAQAVVIPATRGRIIRYRPRFDNWQVTFNLEYDPNLLTETQVRQVVDDTCKRVGFLDFRPAKNGPYGRSMVTKWNGSSA